VICTFVDGETPLPAAIDGITAAFETERARMTVDVVDLVHRPGRLGLLEDVSCVELSRGVS
jgi:hypothetical protein